MPKVEALINYEKICKYMVYLFQIMIDIELMKKFSVFT
jgi:hypothetical protein